MKKDITQDTNFYIIGWACILFVLVYIILKQGFGIDLIDYVGKCTLYTLTGYYCPGCGGTRAVFALVRGDILHSLYMHPFVPYLAVVGGWFMISQTIQRVTKGKLAIAMHFRMIYVWIALGLILLNFIWKNAALLITGVPPM